MSRSIYDLTSPDVAEQIRRNPVAVLPFGSVEQHGPHLPCGTDAISAEMIAAEIAERLDGLLVPFCEYGVTPIHAGHPGTISLSRSTFESLLRDVCGELVGMGIRRFVFVNWHEGNIASLDAVATDLQSQLGVYVATAHVCYTAQRIYAEQGGELTHGGGIETLAILAHDPALARLDRAGEPSRPEGAADMDEMRRSHEVYGYVTDVTEIADDGWYGNPGWASPEHAATFASEVADAAMGRIEGIFAVRDR